MNYIKHLTGFFERIIHDEKLNPTHISLYIALFQYWNVNRFQNPISISRSEIMRISKISAKATYHKCMKELHDLGYIRYNPSYNPFKGSLVHLFNFENIKSSPTRRQLMNQKYSSNRQLEVPYKNYSNIKNKSEVRRPPDVNSQTTPSLDEVELFFKQKKYPSYEAKKYFNHYKALGWKVQGVTPINDWQALAEKWMLNAPKWETTGTVITNLTKQSHAANVQQLYQSFLEGKKISHLIITDHFDELKLELTEEILQQAKQERIAQITGTNNYTLIQLWDAYLKKDEQNLLVQNDRINVIALAKRIAVLLHFYKKKND